MRTSNPALNAKAFDQVPQYSDQGQMTIQGTVNKTFVLLGCLLLSAFWLWSKIFQQANALSAYETQGMGTMVSSLSGYIAGGAILGLIFALVTVFKKEWSPVTAPIYALCEGLVLGGISAIFELRYPGIVVQAVALTFGTLFALLMIYKSGMIKVTQNFRLGIMAATGSICLIYLMTFILGFFNIQIPYIHGSGIVGIGFSLFVVAIASLNLVLDFDFIENASERGLPQYMEWYAAFGLLVTLVWLYIEILKLLAKLKDRR